MPYEPGGGTEPGGQPITPETGAMVGAGLAEEVVSGPPVYAGFWNRAAAAIVDGIVTVVASLLLTGPLLAYVILTGMGDVGDPDGDTMLSVIQGVNQLVSLMGGWLYFALMESSRFQATLGKLAVQIKVTDLEGNRISFGRATGRHFGKLISALMFFVGYLMAAFTSRKQALHDMMAGCVVVRK